MHTKAVFVDRWSLFAGFIHWSSATLYNGRGDWNQKYHNDDKQRTCEKGRVSSFFSLSTSWHTTELFGKRHVKKTAAELLTVALRRENWLMVHDKPGRWSHKAGGRYSQCSFCMKLSVHEKVVVGSRCIARNGRQNPHILIWLGPGRRTGRRRGSVTCTETSPIQSQWRFRSDCLLPSEIGTSWCGRILHSMAFVLFCLYLSKIKRKKKS